MRDVWVARKPPGFAFVEMEDSRDAEDAVRGLDGTRVCGSRVKVEMSTGGKGGGRMKEMDLQDIKGGKEPQCSMLHSP